MSDNQQPTALVARRRDDRDRCIEALQIANAKGPGNLDVPALRRLLDFDKSEFAIVMRRIFDAVNAVINGEQPGSPPRFVDCPHCNEPLEAPHVFRDRLRSSRLRFSHFRAGPAPRPSPQSRSAVSANDRY